MEFLTNAGIVVAIAVIVVVFGMIAMIAKFYRKVPQGKALVRSGMGGLQVAFDKGIFVIPILHRADLMDISVTRLEIKRIGKEGEGLICKDNIRADIKVNFFIRIEKDLDAVKAVAKSVGCERASDRDLLRDLFETKFSEALKTVGRNFDFVDLYNKRKEFREDILHVIGKDLNGYHLDDCAIDYLEQTPIEALNDQNVLDGEGIRKIREITAEKRIESNKIANEERMRIKQQDTIAAEAIAESERQRVEVEERNNKEMNSIKARERADAIKIQEEEEGKASKARVAKEQEISILEDNKIRELMLTQKKRERMEKLESEITEKEVSLEITERKRVVEIANIERERAVAEERKNIQEVLREQVMLEKAVVEEREKTKDIEALAAADREKSVAIKKAEQIAEEAYLKEIKAAEAATKAADLEKQKRQLEAEGIAEQRRIEATTALETSQKESQAKKVMAEAHTVELAAEGLAEAQIIEAKAAAAKKEGEADAEKIRLKAGAEADGIRLTSQSQSEANQKLGKVDIELELERGSIRAKILEKEALAEAVAIEAKAEAAKKQGFAEADVTEKKATVEANTAEMLAEAIRKKGDAEVEIEEKKALIESKRIAAEAEAVKAMNDIGRDMEILKLELNQRKEIELASIDLQKHVAASQAQILGEALKSSKIEIIGGDTNFYDRVLQAASNGKMIDRFVESSQVAQDLKNGLMGEGTDLKNLPAKIKTIVAQFGISSEDMRNLSLSALLLRMLQMSKDEHTTSLLEELLKKAEKAGIKDKTMSDLGLA
ncbi:MAG: flotillin family protein [Bernardetiaceae bacterium]|nr:flotillin family protein [Bernardetiaceae bacterium]